MAFVEQVLDTYYTSYQVAGILGVSHMTLWRWRKSGKLPAYRIGREVLIKKALVEEIKRKRELCNTLKLQEEGYDG